MKRCPLNHRAFADCESNPEAAYWAGMYMTDGCVTYPPGKGPVIGMSLTLGDREHLVKLQKFLCSGHKIGVEAKKGGFGGKPTCYLRFSSKEIAVDLARYGIIPRKSGREKALLLQDNPHFWRGCVDGDGTIGLANNSRPNKIPQIALCGGKCLIEQFAEFSQRVAFGCKATLRLDKSIWAVRISGRHAQKIIRVLYESCLVALDRKLARSRCCLEWTYSKGFDWYELTEKQVETLKAELGTWRAVAAHLGVKENQLHQWRAKYVGRR